MTSDVWSIGNMGSSELHECGLALPMKSLTLQPS